MRVSELVLLLAENWNCVARQRIEEKKMAKTRNEDTATVEGFGKEWGKFTQKEMSAAERDKLFSKYFSIVDWEKRPERVLDMGCGSGRWDVPLAPMVGEVVAADASKEALEVARANVQANNVSFVECTPDTLPFTDGTFDLIFSLGVLHHLPSTEGAIGSLAAKLAPGGQLLIYLYYAFDNRPGWFRMVWRMSDFVRRGISNLPFGLRYAASQVMAIFVYWPLARIAKYFPVPASWPLNFYADCSFYVMRTDALDRFGTKLEKRFTKDEITKMLEAAKLEQIRFRERAILGVRGEKAVVKASRGTRWLEHGLGLADCGADERFKRFGWNDIA